MPLVVCQQFSQLVISCFDSPVFKIREIAAQCLCSLIEDKELFLSKLFSRPNIQSNYPHSSLCLLKNLGIDNWSFDAIKSHNQCPLNVYLMLQLNKNLSINEFSI